MNNSSDSKGLKHELILALLKNLYKNDEKNYEINFEYLQSLDVEKLDEMLGNYYLYYNFKKT